MNCFILASISLDGFIAQSADQSSMEWTSPEDKKWFVTRSKEAGVMVMGSTTFETIGRGLPGRLIVVMSRNEELKKKYQTLIESGEVIITNQTPTDLVTELKDKKYSEIAICGGSSIYTAFMKAGLITKIYLTVEPLVFGKGVGLFNDQISAKCQLIDTKKLTQDTLLLEYDVNV